MSDHSDLVRRIQRGQVVFVESTNISTPRAVLAFCGVCPPCEVGMRWECEAAIDLCSIIEQQAAELEALKHDIAQYVQRDSERLQELEALRKDAERYRYLRVMPRPTEMHEPVWLRMGDDLDEAIDAAIAQQTHSDQEDGA